MDKKENMTNDVTKKDVKREKHQIRLRHKIKSGTLTRSELRLLPSATRDFYMKRELSKKFGDIHWTCGYCAEALLFDDGEITDEEISHLHRKRRDK